MRTMPPAKAMSLPPRLAADAASAAVNDIATLAPQAPPACGALLRESGRRSLREGRSRARAGRPVAPNRVSASVCVVKQRRFGRPTENAGSNVLGRRRPIKAERAGLHPRAELK